jgi:hypothetical protein
MVTTTSARTRAGLLYFAAVTGQFVARGDAYSPTLAVHEVNDEGTGPRCVTRAYPDPAGPPIDFVQHGPGLVDCWHCARNRRSKA